jgi:glyoxylase-like metal-dependent hydrolase (beta-lactamase superfamily II)/ketosteroid isomerase-like protein
MASSGDIAKRYLAALSERDLDAAIDCWQPGAVEEVGAERLVAPDGVRTFFETLIAAFPDLSFELIDATTYRERCAVRWRITGTFVGPGHFQGFVPNGARIDSHGCDLITVRDGLIVASEVFMDSGEIARQLGFLPPPASTAQRRMAQLTNVRTRLRRVVYGPEPEAIAAGVWVVRGGLPRAFNAYLIEDDGGVTLFDAGVPEMGGALATAAVHRGGLRRVVLGNADADHRGGAAGLGAPVFCHADEVDALGSDDPYREYWDLGALPGLTRFALKRRLRRLGGGALAVAGTLAEGDEVAGFRVIELPGHAPGQIALHREEDGLVLASDALLAVDLRTGLGQAPAPPPAALNWNTESTRASIRKLAELRPQAVWLGHGRAIAGAEVEHRLRQAAAAPL